MIRLLAAASAAALLAAVPATAQDMANMPGMDHAAHAKREASPPPAPHDMGNMPGMSHEAAPPPAANPPAQPHDMSAMPGMSHDTPPPAAASAARADDMAGMDMSGGAMTGALGGYAMTREASGTSWQPDASQHAGVHLTRGDWKLMFHATLNGVVDRQQGPRGDQKAFASGMVMGMAKRDFANGDALQLRAMLSPDPFMRPNGYPLLLATGESGDGVTPLVDRQHPHDLFMELSASYSHKLSPTDSLFLYGGLPGEPAFGPPAFMHRLSIADSPEAPISHHWLDSTHITFGVLTAGYIHGNWKLEVSRYKGREPDEHRFDIENPKLDSTAARASWNPSANLSLQVSYAYEKSPEGLEPTQTQRKWSASGIYTVPFGQSGWWSTTAAWGLRSSGHDQLPAWVLESAVKPNAPWTVFARAERVDNNELVPGRHGPTFTVGKVSIGALHDWPIADHVKLGLGGLYAWNFVPDGLARLYGGNDPQGAMGFVRIKID